MKEKGNRKEWIKTVAIIFLSIMLVLTFFSNTIMNYSLPIVATEYVMNGTITSKIRGTGTVEGTDPYMVKLDNGENAKVISSIEVRRGDHIEQGDLLMSFSVTSKTEALEAAEKAVKEAKENYNKVVKELESAVLNGKLTDEDRNNLLKGVRGKYSDYLAEVTNYETIIADFEANKADYQQKKAKAQLYVDSHPDYPGSGDPQKEADYQLYADQIKQYDYLIGIADLNIADLSSKKADILDKVNQENTYYDSIKAAKNALNEANEAYEKLSGEGQVNAIYAPVAGVVDEIYFKSGEEVSAGQTVASIQPDGKGYTMSFSVTNDQAKAVSVGDYAELVNSWYYYDMNIVLASIKPDKADPGKKKMLTFDVSGDVTTGQSLSVSLGQKNANYDLIVPNSAVREDNNGKFILIVESKSSPLGNRYIATRVDVQVVASDDTKSAITGGLNGWEYVITTANKPVEPGQQVRLSEN